MPEQSTKRSLAPKGHITTIDLGGRSQDAYVAVHHSGAGPGVLLLTDGAGLDGGMRARADLFG